jgi:hypothetical protein
MSLRLHKIAEAHHRILNPFTDEKLMLLGEVCRLRPGMRQLDLCSGKGEMLCQWARRWEWKRSSNCAVFRSRLARPVRSHLASRLVEARGEARRSDPRF